MTNLTQTISIEGVTDIELDGIDMNDYPDFCDAYIESASFLDGTPLTDAQLETLNNTQEAQIWVNAHAYESLY